jgi:DNA-binding beta-propeller fold protein YncE
MAISPDGRILYLFSPAYGEGVNKSVNGQLALMSTATLHVTAKHNTGFVLNPCGFAVNPNGTSLFESFCGGSVSGPQEFGVKVLNPNTGLIEKSIPFPRGSRGVVFSPGGKWAYVSDNASSQLDVINTKSDRIVRRVSLPGSSQNTAFGSFPIPLDLLSMSPDGRTIYACPGDILSPDRSIEIIPTPRP